MTQRNTGTDSVTKLHTRVCDVVCALIGGFGALIALYALEHNVMGTTLPPSNLWQPLALYLRSALCFPEHTRTALYPHL